MDPIVVKAVLRFLYSFEYDQYPPGTSSTGTTGMSGLVFCIHLHIVADFFGLSDLEELCVARFEAQARIDWQMDFFADAVEVVYLNAADPTPKLPHISLNNLKQHAEDIGRKDC